MAVDLDAADRELLALLQDRFPLVPAPFAALGTTLGWPEADVLARASTLKAAGPLRQIGAIFDTRCLGYQSTLVALAVEPGRLETVAAAVSRHPGVSHNYGREHAFNLWFTLAVPPGVDLEAEARTLAAQPGVLRTLILTTVRTFKIDVRFDLAAPHPTLSPQGRGRSAFPSPSEGEGQGEGGILQEAGLTLLPQEEPHSWRGAGRLAVEDIIYVQALQEDLPLVDRPFRALAEPRGLSEDDILAAARRLLAGGIMRRYGATLRHRAAGYGANAMACWQVPEERIAAAGQAAAEHRAVSHCYQRPSYPPEWPYQLFTMIHCRSDDELTQVVGELDHRIRPCRYAVLGTGKEFKKVRLRYFEEQMP